MGGSMSESENLCQWKPGAPATAGPGEHWSDRLEAPGGSLSQP